MSETSGEHGDINKHFLEQEREGLRSVLLYGLPGHVAISSADGKTRLDLEYRTPDGESIEVGWHVDETEEEDVYKRLIVDLACVLYGVVRLVQSVDTTYEGILARPTKGHILLEPQGRLGDGSGERIRVTAHDNYERTVSNTDLRFRSRRSDTS